MNDIVIIIIGVVITIFFIYKLGEKNGFLTGFERGKKEAEDEYNKVLSEIEERWVNRHYDYYR